MCQEKNQPYINPRAFPNSRLSLLSTVGAVALVAGFLGGTLSIRYVAQQNLQNANQSTMKETREIIVSKEGLLFRTEEGTPIVRLGMSTYGAYLNLLNTDNKPGVQLLDVRGKGSVNVGTSVGTSVSIKGFDDGGNITMIGRYGKEVVTLSSYTKNGGGSLVLSEGAKGYKSIDIGTEENQKNFKGRITILNDNGTVWEAP